MIVNNFQVKEATDKIQEPIKRKVKAMKYEMKVAKAHLVR
jgi:hypothetical protein